jgi:hypothetical protein
MAARHGLDSESLASDAAPVNHAVEALFDAGIDVRSLHDPTRGGLKSVTNEVAERSGLRIVLDEAEVPVRPQVRAVCELLGLDPLGLACEGRFLAWVPEDGAHAALDVPRRHRPGRRTRRDRPHGGPARRRRSGGAPYAHWWSSPAGSAVGYGSSPHLLIRRAGIPFHPSGLGDIVTSPQFRAEACMRASISPEALRSRLDRILPSVQKPSRYLGLERNLVRKGWDEVSVRMALAFPDAYEIGMSTRDPESSTTW